MNRICGLLLFLICSLSCTNSRLIYPIEDLTEAFTKDGKRDLILKEGNKYLWFVTYDNLSNDLYHTPSGKIDRIMNENPDWQFICYCHCPISDSSKVVGKLNQYNCSLPVIIDEEGCFLKINGIKDSYSDIGFICDKRGRCLGVSTIGTTQSFFDQEFSNAKRKVISP